MKWEELTSPRLGAIDRRTPVLLNIGAIEQHGGHLPLVTDALIGRHFTDRIDAELGEHVLVLPQIAVCCSRHHMAFPGTLTVRHETFLAYLTDMLEAVVAHGFTNIVLFNSHGGNLAIAQVVLEAFGNDHPEIEIFLLTWWKIAAEELAAIQESGFGGVGHACEFETSLVQLIAPHLIDEAAAVDQLPIHAHEWAAADMLQGARAAHHRTMHQLTAGTGTSGCPSLASPEKGRRISDAVVSTAVKMLRDIREQTPEKD
ncbi:creatininase family protein [Sphingosinicella sp. BN140058]|uniref:creatininase family protein n=1 Tax=Sphingosinicella sp. BN140058 TaxID=1892855 RepID=UPI00101202BA|nr:creatininase family protein [Sphingosinicella sp. BN140058]QAY75667.1 creatininase family protein [Sphingosinicella sp. BN140058]